MRILPIPSAPELGYRGTFIVLLRKGETAVGVNPGQVGRWRLRLGRPRYLPVRDDAERRREQSRLDGLGWLG